MPSAAKRGRSESRVGVRAAAVLPLPAARPQSRQRQPRLCGTALAAPPAPGCLFEGGHHASAAAEPPRQSPGQSAPHACFKPHRGQWRRRGGRPGPGEKHPGDRVGAERAKHPSLMLCPRCRCRGCVARIACAHRPCSGVHCPHPGGHFLHPGVHHPLPGEHGLLPGVPHLHPCITHAQRCIACSQECIHHAQGSITYHPAGLVD